MTGRIRLLSGWAMIGALAVVVMTGTAAGKPRPKMFPIVSCGIVRGGYTAGLGVPDTDTWLVVTAGTPCKKARHGAEVLTGRHQTEQEDPNTYDSRVEYGFATENGRLYECVSNRDGPAYGGGCYTHFEPNSDTPLNQGYYFTWAPERAPSEPGSCGIVGGARYSFGTAGNGGLQTNEYKVTSDRIRCSFAEGWASELTYEPHGRHPPGRWVCEADTEYRGGGTPDATCASTQGEFGWEPVNYMSS